MAGGKVVFVNVTKLCNINCPRCYLTPESRAQKDRLEPSHLISFIDHSFFKEPEPVKFIFQGGEPQVMGADYYDQCIHGIKQILPEATFGAVTNLYTAHDWFLELAKEHFGSAFDTTFALGEKFTLAGSHSDYLKKFIASAKRSVDAGVAPRINVELNPETVAATPQALIDIAHETGVVDWEFDHSVAFNAFARAPKDLPGHPSYPHLPNTVPYQEYADFIWEFLSLWGLHFPKTPLNNGFAFLSRMQKGEGIGLENMAFNVGRELEFLTINPDLTLTTNPLFSDIQTTYLGSLAEHSLDTLLANPERHARARYEKVRALPCQSCRYLNLCGGGPSHVPVFDGSGECAGAKSVFERLKL